MIKKIINHLKNKKIEYENVREKYYESTTSKYKFQEMLEEVWKIKIIEEDTNEKFCDKYNYFIKSLKRDDFWELGNVRALKEEKLDYIGEKYIKAFKYKEIELKKGITIENYHEALKCYNENEKIYKNAEIEYNEKYSTDFYTSYVNRGYN